jgi:hypothetical protein
MPVLRGKRTLPESFSNSPSSAFRIGTLQHRARAPAFRLPERKVRVCRTTLNSILTSLRSIMDRIPTRRPTRHFGPGLRSKHPAPPLLSHPALHAGLAKVAAATRTKLCRACIPRSCSVALQMQFAAQAEVEATLVGGLHGRKQVARPPKLRSKSAFELSLDEVPYVRNGSKPDVALMSGMGGKRTLAATEEHKPRKRRVSEDRAHQKSVREGLAPRSASSPLSALQAITHAGER